MSILKDTALYFSLTVPLTILGVLMPWFNLVFLVAILCSRIHQDESLRPFDVIKFLLVIAGLIAYYFIPSASLLLLRVNIHVAVVQDILNGNSINAVFGSLLALWASVTPGIAWLIAYCIWNSIFTLQFRFSASTRLILLTGLIAHACTDIPWVVCRCVSLMVNMALRANEVTDVFTPGKTWVTD